MKILAFTALLAFAKAGDEAKKVEKLEEGGDCSKAKGNCGEGLCCAEGVFEEDVVDGKVSDNYKENMITVCVGEKAEEFSNDDGKFYMTCLKLSAYKLAAAATVVMSAVMLA